jgi:hypothetical protein
MERNEWEGEKEVRVSLCKGGKAIRLCDETVDEEQGNIELVGGIATLYFARWLRCLAGNNSRVCDGSPIQKSRRLA